MPRLPRLTVKEYQALPTKRRKAFDVWLTHENLMDKYIFDLTLNAETMQVQASRYEFVMEGSQVKSYKAIQTVFPISTLPPEGEFS